MELDAAVTLMPALAQAMRVRWGLASTDDAGALA